MSLSKISNEHLNNLFLSLYNGDNSLELIKSNHVNYARLKQIAKQMEYLKKEALEIIDDTRIQNELHQIKPKFKLVSGNNYYVYQKPNNEKYFSLISPNEWNNKDIYLGQYYYDFDKQFVLI